jgi:DNA transformation protein
VGEKSARLTGDATETAEWLVDSLSSMGALTSKQMFGGFGVFCGGVMFALVDSTGLAHLRADESSAPACEESGSAKHSRMPYWSIPEAVLTSDEQLVTWATRALSIAQAAKK